MTITLTPAERVSVAALAPLAKRLGKRVWKATYTDRVEWFVSESPTTARREHPTADVLRVFTAQPTARYIASLATNGGWRAMGELPATNGRMLHVDLNRLAS